MILMLLLEVRQLKNIIKLTTAIITTITAVIVKIMKTIPAIKVVLKIKLITPHRHHRQQKLFSYLETAW